MAFITPRMASGLRGMGAGLLSQGYTRAPQTGFEGLGRGAALAQHYMNQHDQLAMRDRALQQQQSIAQQRLELARAANERAAASAAITNQLNQQKLEQAKRRQAMFDQFGAFASGGAPATVATPGAVPEPVSPFAAPSTPLPLPPDVPGQAPALPAPAPTPAPVPGPSVSIPNPETALMSGGGMPDATVTPTPPAAPEPMKAAFARGDAQKSVADMFMAADMPVPALAPSATPQQAAAVAAVAAQPNAPQTRGGQTFMGLTRDQARDVMNVYSVFGETAAVSRMNAIRKEAQERQAKSQLSAKEMITFENAQNKEFENRANVKTYRSGLPAYRAMLKAAQDPGPAAGETLIVNFAKMLDPTSVVQQGEAQRIVKSGGMWDRLNAMLSDVQRGNPINARLRMSLLRQARNMMEQRGQEAMRTEQEFIDASKSAGLRPGRVVRRRIDLNKLPQLPKNFDASTLPGLAPPRLSGHAGRQQNLMRHRPASPTDMQALDEGF